MHLLIVYVYIHIRVYLSLSLYIYISIYTYLSLYIYICICVCIYIYIHMHRCVCIYIYIYIYTYVYTYIHTYIHTFLFSFSANSEHDESFRSVDRTSQWHSAQRLASAPRSENLARPAWAVHPLPQPFIFFKFYGEGATITNLARGHHAILSRYDTATKPTRCEMCVGPEVPSSTPQGSSTPFITLTRQCCLQPLGLAGPGDKQKVQSRKKFRWEHRKMAGD